MGDIVTELMFLSSYCSNSSAGRSISVVGALREAGSIRSVLGDSTTLTELHDILPWDNHLVVLNFSSAQLRDMLTDSVNLSSSGQVHASRCMGSG